MQQASGNLLAYTGSGGRLFGIWLKNLFLMLITLTIYRAWAKTRIRKYLWANVQVDGDPLYYTGTGGELFRGYVKVALLFFIISILLLVGATAFFGDEPIVATKIPESAYYEAMEQCGYTAENWDALTHEISEQCLQDQGVYADYAMPTKAELVQTFGIWPLLLYLIHFGRYSALRYRLSRTHWRGIRGRMTGKANGYAWLAIGRMLLNLLTLGLLVPKSDMIKQSYLFRDMYLGSQRASFQTYTEGLMGVHVMTLLLAIPTLGLSRFWYQAALQNRKLSCLAFGPVSFHGTYTGGRCLRLQIGNMFLFLLTLGFGMPYIINRIVNFHIQNTVMTGDIAGSQIAQAQGDAGTMGEGFSEQLGDGFDFDFGLI